MKYLYVPASLTLLLMGCSETPILTSMSVKLLTTPPLPVEVSAERIVLPEGVAVGLEIIGRDQKGEQLDVREGGFVGDVEFVRAQDRERFILNALEPGMHTITVAPMDGNGSLDISVEVTAQTPPTP